MHVESTLQVVRHAVPLAHVYGSQLEVIAPLHDPVAVPLQNVIVTPPALWYCCPTPGNMLLHVPEVEHTFEDDDGVHEPPPLHPPAAQVTPVQLPCGSCPIGTEAHVPGVERLHDLHPEHCASAVSQQTVSTQLLDLQSAPVEQDKPLFFGPHEPGETDVLHGFGERHCVLSVHDVKQAVPSGLHTYGSQATIVVGATQFPLPSHFESPICFPAAHEPALQTTLSHLRQLPLPSQVPSRPQLDGACAPQVPWAGMAPAETGEQVPARPATLHDEQAPMHAVSQQTLSTQFADEHWPAVAHVVPLLLSAGMLMSISEPPVDRSSFPDGCSPFFQHMPSTHT